MNYSQVVQSLQLCLRLHSRSTASNPPRLEQGSLLTKTHLDNTITRSHPRVDRSIPGGSPFLGKGRGSLICASDAHVSCATVNAPYVAARQYHVARGAMSDERSDLPASQVPSFDREEPAVPLEHLGTVR